MYIVTGVSRGLGEAIVYELLERNEEVIGIGRHHQINHPNFSFITCDLSNRTDVVNLHIPKLAGKVTLINNAGILGEIKQLSSQDELVLGKVMEVNVISPIQLLQKVYACVEDKNDFSVVNISSGAANRAIPSWASYCASKSALNMLTETFYLEEIEKGNSPKVYAVAPGVIDTDMQQQIRSTELSDFSGRDNFREMKEANQLFSSREAAKRLLHLLDRPFDGKIKCDLREVDIA